MGSSCSQEQLDDLAVNIKTINTALSSNQPLVVTSTNITDLQILRARFENVEKKINQYSADSSSSSTSTITLDQRLADLKTDVDNQSVKLASVIKQLSKYKELAAAVSEISALATTVGRQYDYLTNQFNSQVYFKIYQYTDTYANPNGVSYKSGDFIDWGVKRGATHVTLMVGDPKLVSFDFKNLILSSSKNCHFTIEIELSPVDVNKEHSIAILKNNIVSSTSPVVTGPYTFRFDFTSINESKDTNLNIQIKKNVDIKKLTTRVFSYVMGF